MAVKLIIEEMSTQRKLESQHQTTSRAMALLLGMRRHYGEKAEFVLDKNNCTHDTWHGNVRIPGAEMQRVRVEFHPLTANRGLR